MSPDECTVAQTRAWQSALLDGAGAPHWFSWRKGPDPGWLAGELTSGRGVPARARQVHGSRCVDASECDELRTCEADAIATRDPHRVPMVTTADCVPVLVYCSETESCAAIHAGWRGIALDVVGATIRHMVEHFGCAPESMIAAVGPCASHHRYEVGADVAEAFTRRGLKEHLLPAARDAKWFADCAGGAAALLMRAGLAHGAIDRCSHCTITDERLASHRREPACGDRMLAAIAVRSR